MLAPGQNIERYTVEAVIGQGGMAVVYRVRHNQLGSHHALKILTVPKPHIRERLLQEGRVQAGIRHNNVVSVTDVVEIDGSPALLMEFVDGPTLEEWLEGHRPTLEEAEDLFRGICAGVGEAHAHGLVHRDLKPANVLLASGRGVLVPKVTDFGIAKILASDHPDGGTRTNIAMGTPHYMAPEQIRDAKTVDQRADVFSLGCILYELVCGEKPFQGPDVLTVLNSVATGRYVPPQHHVPDLPDRFVRSLQGCLRVEREFRIQDCFALIEALSGAAPSERRVTRPLLRTVTEPTGPRSNPPMSIGRVLPLTLDIQPPMGGEPPVEAVDETTDPPAALRTSTAAARSASGGAPITPVDPEPTPSWFDEDLIESVPGRAASTGGIDPNASTVPSPPRRIGPGGRFGRSDRRMIVAAVVGGSLGFLTLMLLVGLLQPSARGTGTQVVDDELVLPVTQLSAAPPDVQVVEAPAEPEPVAPSTAPSYPVAPPRAVLRPGTVGTSARPEESTGFLWGAREVSAPLDVPWDPVPGTGRLRVSGDAEQIALVPTRVASLGRQSPGIVPVGRYGIEVAFAGRAPRVVLEIDVREGETLRVTCASVSSRCQLLE
jgi:serine/threonine-protein kinase